MGGELDGDQAVGASRAAVALGGSAEANRSPVGTVRSFNGGVSSGTRSRLPSHRVGTVPGSTGNADGKAPAGGGPAQDDAAAA